MAYKHGVYTGETPTSIVPAANSTAGLPVVFGTAPVHLATDRATVKIGKSILFAKLFTVSILFMLLLQRYL